MSKSYFISKSFASLNVLNIIKTSMAKKLLIKWVWTVERDFVHIIMSIYVTQQDQGMKELTLCTFFG